MSNFYSIKSEIDAEITIKKSRFIAWAVPVDDADKVEELLEKARQIWPGARHYCYAYIIKQPYQEKYSDDGEPAGTAGLPILNIIKHHNLTNVIVIVVRYFGGILLGASGLIRAYSSAASDALDKAEKQLFILCQTVKTQIDYAYWGKVEYLCNSESVPIDQIKFDTSVKADFLVPTEKVQSFKQKLTSICNGTVVINCTEKRYYSFD